MNIRLDLDHATNPIPGDVWQEMGAAVCLVLDVDDNYVTCCTERNYNTTYNESLVHDFNFDLKYLRRMTKSQFKKFLSYRTCPGFWANVIPNNERTNSFLETYKKLIENREIAYINQEDVIQLELNFV